MGTRDSTGGLQFRGRSGGAAARPRQRVLVRRPQLPQRGLEQAPKLPERGRGSRGAPGGAGVRAFLHRPPELPPEPRGDGRARASRGKPVAEYFVTDDLRDRRGGVSAGRHSSGNPRACSRFHAGRHRLEVPRGPQQAARLTRAFPSGLSIAQLGTNFVAERRLPPRTRKSHFQPQSRWGQSG